MILGKAGSALIGQFIYAIIITLVVIFATITVSRAAERARLLEERRRLEDRTPITDKSSTSLGEYRQTLRATAAAGRRRPRAPHLKPHR